MGLEFVAVDAAWAVIAVVIASLAPAFQAAPGPELDLADMANDARPLGEHFPASELEDPLPAHPLLDPEEGLGPGRSIQILFPDGSRAGCSANFIWEDPSGNLYVGTAGHCLLPPGSTATHGPDADYNASDVVVQFALEGCKLKLSTFVAATTSCLERDGPTWADLGAVVYARRGLVGTDFGLIRVPEEQLERVRTQLPWWGGPTGESASSAGDSILHYGRGLGYDAAPVLRRRVGEAIDEQLVKAFTMAGFVNAGDSGSGAVLGRFDESTATFVGEEATAILTHGAAYVAGVFFGTTVAQAKRDVLCYVGLEVRVVPGGEFLPGVDEDCASDCPDCSVPRCPPTCPTGDPPTFHVGTRRVLNLEAYPGVVEEVDIASDRPFRVTMWGATGSNLVDDGRLLTVIAPVSELEGGPETCAAPSSSWTVLMEYAGGFNRTARGTPTHPPGSYRLLLASPFRSRVSVFFDSGSGAETVPTTVTNRTLEFVRVDQFVASDATSTIRFDHNMGLAPSSLFFGTFEPNRALSAGRGVTTSWVGSDGLPCAESQAQGVEVETFWGDVHPTGDGWLVEARALIPGGSLTWSGEFRIDFQTTLLDDPVFGTRAEGFLLSRP